MIRYFLLVFVFILHSIFLFPQNAQKNVLLEEFSTCPCGFCPEGGIYAENLINKYPNLFTYTHHAGFGTDSMTITESKTLAYTFTTFAPAGVIDRGHYPIPVYTDSNYIAISRQKWDSVVTLRLNEAPLADVSFTQSFDIETRQLDVKIDAKFLSTVESKDYRMNLAIIEDSVTGIGPGFDQKSYFNEEQKYPSLYHKGDTIKGYIHRHVLRALPAGTWGVAGIIPNSPVSGSIYSYELKGYKLPERWKTKDISLVAFVSYYSTDKFKHKILNSSESKLYIPTEVNQESTIPQTQNKMEIFPNPVSDLGYIVCFFATETAANFEIFSVTGEKIRSIKSGTFSGQCHVYFYVSDLPSGIYFIKVTSNNGVVCKKFAVM